MHRSTTTALLALPLALAACSNANDGCSTCNDPTYYETEINDTAAQANWVGVLYPGDVVTIRGGVTQWGPDLYDGFSFVTGAPMTIDFEVWADVPGVDLDLCVWDPVFKTFVACFETDLHPEAGQVVILEANKEFHLVVRSYFGDSGYFLDVFGGSPVYGAQALGAAPEERVPGAWEAYDEADEPQREELPGQAVTLFEVAADGALLDARPARALTLDAAR